MSTSLPNCKKLEIRNSTIEGFGVFATADIARGEVLEEIPFILFPRNTALGKAIFDLLGQTGYLSQKEKYYENLRANLKFKDPEKYYFKWFPQVGFEGDPIAYTVLPLGNGPIYNTANVDNNAGWIVKEKTFVFRAEKDIKSGDEIRTFYGYFVAQDGSIFNCDQVFNLALETYDNLAKCKMIRFGSNEQFTAAQQNPFFIRIGQLLSAAREGLTITRIAACTPDNTEKAATDFLADIPLNVLYQKLLEFKSSHFPIFKITVKYVDALSGAEQTEVLTFRK
jgi:hypothetical protein